MCPVSTNLTTVVCTDVRLTGGNRSCVVRVETTTCADIHSNSSNPFTTVLQGIVQYHISALPRCDWGHDKWVWSRWSLWPWQHLLFYLLPHISAIISIDAYPACLLRALRITDFTYTHTHTPIPSWHWILEESWEERVNFTSFGMRVSICHMMMYMYVSAIHVPMQHIICWGFSVLYIIKG